MIEPIKMLFRWQLAGKSRPQSMLSRPRRVRLHAELLEGRLLMAADSAASARLDPFTPQNSDAAVVVVADLTAGDVAAPTITASHIAQDGWAQFGSKAAFEAWLIETAVAQYGNMFGQRSYGYGGWHHWMPRIDWDTPMLLGATDVISTNFSQTNLQEAGVDEADLIETDGSYLYIISGEDLVIVRAGVGEDLEVVSRVHIGGRPAGMFLSGDRLAIVSENTQHDYFNNGWREWLTIDMAHSLNPTSPKTTVTIFNLGDRTDPSMVQKSEMDGRLVASRVVDGELRLVLSNDFRLPPPIAKPVATEQRIPPKYLAEGQPMMTFGIIGDVWLPNNYGQEYVYETKDEYLERVRDSVLDTFLPRVRNLDSAGEIRSERALVDAAKLYRPESPSETSITTIATFNLASNRRGPVATESIFTNGAPQVYATADSTYLFAQKPYDWSSNSYTPSTQIWKFDFNGGRNGIKLAARGVVDGTVLNQFAADEENGFLRVVTESWTTSGHEVHVLQQVGRQLEVVGSIADIASGERLYSVRFLGNRAFFVTFRQTDPLYAVDLSDPTSPRLMGELHIPGYSDYLQPIDENHLLAIGRGANESNGQFEELQVSIFDVSDLTNPRLVHRYSFDGGRTTSTPATGNRWTRGDGDHHALSYFAEEQILALPIFSEHDWDPQNTSLFTPGEGGLQVFKIDVETGFTSLGVIEHETLVNRSLRIGEQLFAISAGTVSVHELENPTTRLGEVSILAPPGSPVRSPELIVDPRIVLSRSPIVLPESSLPSESENQLAAIWSESPAPQHDSEPAVESFPAPQVGWAPPSLTRARHAQPTIFSRDTSFTVSTRAGAQLLDLLATQNAAHQSDRDAAIFELNSPSTTLEDADAVAREFDFALSPSAFDDLDQIHEFWRAD
jgi:uncharacterized secreted protein with C-terminal beta-propeller domain